MEKAAGHRRGKIDPLIRDAGDLRQPTLVRGKGVDKMDPRNKREIKAEQLMSSVGALGPEGWSVS